MTRRLLLHVGYHKTATTWLQRVYFPGHPGIEKPFVRAELSRIIVRPHAFVFDPDAAREQLMERIGPALDAGKTVVLSNERFTGNPASGGVDAFEMVDRLFETLPEAAVWLQFREQASMINSYYNQFIKQGGTCSIKTFLAENPTHKRIPHFTMDYFHYLPLVRRFEERFGADNVLSNPFEEFKADRDGVLSRVGRLTGFEHDPDVGKDAKNVNESLSDRSIRTLRVLNGLFTHSAAHRHYRPLVRLPGNRFIVKAAHASDKVLGRRGRRIQRRIKDAVGDYYAASNRDLGAHLGVDLAAWGYPVAPPDPAPVARLRARKAKAT